MKTLTILPLLASCALAAPVPLSNPSLEINSGTDGLSISDPSLLGWQGNAILSEGDTDYGNGRWK